MQAEEVKEIGESGPGRTEEISDQERRFTEEVIELNEHEIRNRINIFENNVRIMKGEESQISHEKHQLTLLIEDNKKKLENNKQLPYLVANVVEILDNTDPKYREDHEHHTTAIIKTSTRQTIFLPVPGLVNTNELKPTDILGVNKDSYLILDKLPQEFDSRVKAMELEEKPEAEYSDIGGLDKQIEELREAIVFPILHRDKFEKIGLTPPKGVLMHGPPGTGKTMLARACAAQTNATFLKLAGPQLVQMFIGDGAKIVRDAFALAKEKAPTIIFIDEIDAVGTKRFDSEKSGDREVQRTMLELLNQLDGFSSDADIKVIAATNRPDVLDPALMRSGRLDRKIEFPHPNEDARVQILQIHSRRMNYDREDVNFKELARATDGFNGAQLKAVCVEAGMNALKRDADTLVHEDYVDGIITVQSKKKSNLNYYA
jgi:26S proteasome regulatory subunit T5